MATQPAIARWHRCPELSITDAQVQAAAREFWGGRSGGTQAAKHDKPFLNLIADDLTSLGWSAHVAQAISDKNAIIGGHFRRAKSWDIVCRNTRGQPRICVEFKSQVDSYGNNENNRYEEALGSGLDLRAKYGSLAVLGFLLVICDEPKTRAVTRARLPDIDPRFENSSHIERRIVFAERIVNYKLNGDSLYNAAALLLLSRDGTVQHPENPALRIFSFATQLAEAAGPRD